MEPNNDIPRLSRLTAILTLLQSKRILTAAEIAGRFGISKRTVYRDIKALEVSGVPIFTEEGKGYSLVEGYRLAPVMFTEEEANALVTAEKLMDKMGDRSLVAHHQNAISKVRAVLRHSEKDKAELLFGRISFLQHPNGPNVQPSSTCLSTIQVAITNLKPLHIKYHSIGKNESTERTVEPQALYHTKGNWVMIAWCRLRDSFREFRVDRIAGSLLLDSPFEDRGFDLVAYFHAVAEKSKN